MERRSFFKILGTASGGVLTGACGKQAKEIIPLLVPEREIVAGEEEWRPSVCRECGAGCGVIVRVMAAEREVLRNGSKFRERIAAVKKVEGNPLDPVSGGRLCARGQAVVQEIYHPDRVRGPMKRSGSRGEGRFQAIGWDTAIGEAAAAFQRAVEKDPARIIFLARDEAGSRSAAIRTFLRAIGAPPAWSTGICHFEIERQAAEAVFGWKGLPVYEMRDADVVLGIGADFLGGWVSPVFYSRQFGHMRRGRPGRRGRLIHAESRFSVTAASADRWLPVRPGGELALALAIGHVLATENPEPGQKSDALRKAFAAVDFGGAAAVSGIPADQIRQTARELISAEAPMVVAGATVVQTNSLDAVIAADALNLLLRSVERGRVSAPPPGPIPEYAESRPRHGNPAAILEPAELLVLDGVNPVYTQPSTAKLLGRARSVISFSTFIDDSTADADLILPDHAALESAAAIIPAVSPDIALTAGAPIVQPLYDSRSIEQVLVGIAAKLGRTFSWDAPSAAFQKIYAQYKPEGDWSGAVEFADACERQGGWWAKANRRMPAPRYSAVPALREAEFKGSASEFPLTFQPYPSVQFGEGEGAKLPWMQELPDPVSSAMWGLPVEIDPQTAARLGVKNGHMVRVTSAHGHLEAPAYVHPAAIPGVVSMAIGQGHTNFGRYASGRGANPLAICAPAVERTTGVFAFGATRVRVERLPAGNGLIQFSRLDREPEIHRK